MTFPARRCYHWALSTVTIPAQVTAADPKKRRTSLLLVFICTIVGAAAQILIKQGAGHLTQPGFTGAVIGMFTNLPLFAGYCLYGINAVLFVLALREGELSLLYPIIALTYVWVSILSVYYFHESMNALKITGLVVIVAGVAILGRGGRR